MGAILLLEPARLSLASVVRIDALSRWLTGAGPDIDALRNTIRGSRHPVARIRAWQWLARPNLASACVDRLARAHDAAEHEAVLTAMHLASNPRRSSAAVGIARRAGFGRAAPRISGGEIDSNSAAPSIAPQSAVPRPSEIPALSPRAKWGLARWVGLIDAPARIRRAVLDPLLTDHMPGVRLSAARVAMADDLADYCFDEDAAVARTSIIRWSDAGVRRTRAMPLAADRARRRLLEKLTHSPHGFVRRVARDDLAWGTPLAADPSDHAARPFNLAAVGDPTGLIPTLEQELASAPGPRAGLALRVIQRLGLASSMQDQLVALVPKPSDPPASLFENSAAELPAQSRLAASAVSTLAEVPAADRSPACIRALASALHDADDRVRANAVDGVARDARRNAADESSRAVLRELKSDPHHRVRASAVRGLIWSSTTGERRAPHGGELVIDMLGDHRPLHRLAGVWLCERWALAGAAAHDELARATGQLRGLSEHDLDPRITARATRAIRRIRVLSGHDPIAAAHREDA